MTSEVVNAVYFGILGVALIAGIAASVVLPRRLSSVHPQFKSYAWGYFRGVSGVVASAIFLVATLWAWSRLPTSQSHLAMPYLAYFIVQACAHAAIVKRYKIGWIVGTALSLNPILWLTDGLYAYRRWHELEDFSSRIRRRDHPHPVDQ
jgi:hypothetical protein